MSKLIVLDPGHGGKDTGALGNGLREKDVVFDDDAGNLGIAQRVRHHLALAGYRVILTRMADVFVPLSARARMAVEAGADAFISLHCNASTSQTASGIEIFRHPREQNGAGRLARLILDALLRQPEAEGMKDRGVKTANFRVLQVGYKHMPAVLIETGFITNRGDAERLRSRFFREAWARAIAVAVREVVR